MTREQKIDYYARIAETHGQRKAIGLLVDVIASERRGDAVASHPKRHGNAGRAG